MTARRNAWRPPAPLRRTPEQLAALEEGIKATYTDRSQDTLIRQIGADVIMWSGDMIMIKRSARSEWMTIAIWIPETGSFGWTSNVA